MIALLAILAFRTGASAAGQAPDPGLARLQQTLASFEKLSGGRLGIAAIHLETGRSDIGIIAIPHAARAIHDYFTFNP